MAKTKTKAHSKQKDILRSTTSPLVKGVPKKSPKSIEDLLTEAAELLEQSQPELALPLAEEALKRLEVERQEQHAPEDEDAIDIEDLLSLAAQGLPTLPPALTLNAEIQVALGDVDAARRNFTRATRIDRDGALISAEPWLWLAQLCEEGGKESIGYFEQACEVLRNEIEVLEEAVNEMDTGSDGDAGTKRVLDEKKSKLADALCAMAEVYMTDLSWENDAESRCEALVTEAVAVCPEHLSAGVLQTLASVRISQERIEDARTALRRSLDIWKDAPSASAEDSSKETGSAGEAGVGDDGRKPDFATRVSLSRLLMEVQLEELAMSVLEGLIREDDQSVECWYLGGWCQVLVSQKPDAGPETRAKCLETANQWLENCLRLYRVLGYEDERLREHAVELVQGLKQELGLGEGEMDDGDAWEDVDDQEDDEDEEDGDLEIEADGEDEPSSRAGAKATDGDVEMT